MSGERGSWLGSRVLVTGASGFIGSHVVEALVRKGAQVRAFLRYTSYHSRGALDCADSDVMSHTEVVFGDLRDPDSVARAVSSCDTVLHLGALVSVPYSYLHARSFFETNAIGTLNVALAARDGGVARLLAVSSSEVYGSPCFLPIDEQHPVHAQSPYAASKASAEQIVHSFARSFELTVTVVRPFNTYGPRQTARAIVPTILSQAARGSVVRLGSLWPRRDLTYVDDTVDGLLALARAPEAAGEVVNLGTGHDVSIAALVDLVAETVGRNLEVKVDNARIRPQTSEVSRLQCDASKAAALVGWSTKLPLPEGLQRTAGWIGDHLYLYENGAYLV